MSCRLLSLLNAAIGGFGNISFILSEGKRPKVDPSNYMFDGLTNQTVCKLPGSLNGKQFIVQNCKNCNIYLYDYTSTVTVDDCIDCNFFIGPIQTSIFIRDCTGCKFVVACQQFRLRDCQNLDAFLCCATQPIIESSSRVKLACFTYYYPELAGQFKDAKLSVFNNNWSNIHDFTQDDNMKHFTLLPEDCKVDDFVPLPSTDDFQFLEISLDPKKSVVPRSLGNRRKTSDESCLIVFFFDGSSQERALKFIDEMTNSHPDCILVQTKELKMSPPDALRVFGSDAYDVVVSRGPVIGLEYNGENCIQICQEVIMGITKGLTGLVFISQSRETADEQIENYYNFADMQMAV
ncbi:LOW QUALITY PROTEIN: protein XRP2-like [Ruditapes philippinarum]|uniref:LOW QUALITY PROTEIN: protein XRP2-like n=1 Tax=Ruditapes philippinarum TaxID=129788 RepID=UPI00295ADB43|nr:LOW QUALITY PROTEIN: protein XRP2-like [Ruditapes philippinarum]